jgi:CPA2 family monovalent cation:H+ antiporter-2
MTGQSTPFIATVVISLALAYAGGVTARTIGLPNIVGYLAAGILVGPYTPGFVADQHLSTELAEIGVALLMFTIGLHFSLRDLIAVWHVAVPGALIQVIACTGLGCAIGVLLGWPLPASLVLGLGISISSTAVAIKALEDRRQLTSETGRIVLGWLVVQDIIVILALVMLPQVSRNIPGLFTLFLIVSETMLMVAIFAGLLLGIGRWLLPAILAWTARFGSQELFTLGVIVIALGIAYGSASLLGLSLALGAFFAGLVLGESDLSHQSAAESLPIQNIFTILFFVSVGMLFDPKLFLTAPAEIAGLVLAIVIGCGMVFVILMLGLGVRPKIAGDAGGTLAQVGEFSFILSSLAVTQAVMTGDQRGTLLAAALVSILLHSLTMRAYGWLGMRLEARLPKRLQGSPIEAPAEDPEIAELQDHVIVVGHGRVGSVVTRSLRDAQRRYCVIEGEWRVYKAARALGGVAIFGDATRAEVFRAARPDRARLVVVAMPDAFQSRRVIELAREANAKVGVVARAHSNEEYEYLTHLGVDLAVMGEREIALSMADYVLQQAGVDAARAQALVDRLRAGMNNPVPAKAEAS